MCEFSAIARHSKLKVGTMKPSFSPKRFDSKNQFIFLSAKFSYANLIIANDNYHQEIVIFVHAKLVECQIFTPLAAVDWFRHTRQQLAQIVQLFK
jgi:hypothetical protein